MKPDATVKLPNEAIGDAARRRLEVAAAMDPNSATQATVIPERIGKYAVEKLIGHGGMGVVYLARHPETGLPLAIKMVRSEWAEGSPHLERFLQEARLVSGLNHPNIVRVYDVDRHEGRPYIVQEYVDGGDAASLLASRAEGALDYPTALRIVIGVAEALKAAAARHIVHRDVKPANILLTRDGQPKLSDLGIAKQLQPTAEGAPTPATLTAERVAIGSTLYMAPEQLVDSRKVDIRADIYSLGVTFYQLVTGELPFVAKSIHEMRLRHRHEDAPDPRAVRAGLPSAATAVILRMLAKDPDQRYQTPDELLTDLCALRDPQPWYRLNWVRAAALLLLVSALLGLVLRPKPDVGPSIGAAENLLAAGDYAQATPILESVLHQVPDNARALYALGLCCLNTGENDRARTLISRIESGRQGEEYARHLEVLLLIAEDRLEEASDRLQRYEREARHKLPFLLSRGMILLNRRNLSGAETALTKAVQEAGFFSFDRLQAVDALGKLFMMQGKPQEAAKLYAQNLDTPAEGHTPPPRLLTNYAAALMDSGDADKARQTLDLALQVHPQDEMALYLRRRAEESASRAGTDQMTQTMVAIRELNDRARKDRGDARSRPKWTTSPLVLLFRPVDNRAPAVTRLGEADRWVDLLVRRVQQSCGLPVVDRTNLSQVLTELQIAGSDLASPDVQVQLGRLWPASVLVQPTLEWQNGRVRLSLQLTDIQTTEIIAILSEEGSAGAGADAVVAALVDQMAAKLREHTPPVGTVTAVVDGRAELSLGAFHGLQSGQELAVFEADDKATPKTLSRTAPVGKARVTGVERLSATAEFTPATEAGRKLAVGMVVMGTR